jgi:hypothetical protein
MGYGRKGDVEGGRNDDKVFIHNWQRSSPKIEKSLLIFVKNVEN